MAAQMKIDTVAIASQINGVKAKNTTEAKMEPRIPNPTNQWKNENNPKAYAANKIIAIQCP